MAALIINWEKIDLTTLLYYTVFQTSLKSQKVINVTPMKFYRKLTNRNILLTENDYRNERIKYPLFPHSTGTRLPGDYEEITVGSWRSVLDMFTCDHNKGI